MHTMSMAVEKGWLAPPVSATVAGLFRRWWWMIAAFFLAYGQIVVSLARDWWTNDDYAHGLFTPFAVAYLVYQRRKELTIIPVAPSTVGFMVILASQAVLIVGFLGAEFFLQRVSMLIFFAGTILFWGMARPVQDGLRPGAVSVANTAA